MKVLVTGASGFIGSHVVESLVEAGHQVRGLDLGKGEGDWVQGDVTDEEVARRAVQGCDAVCHLAARVGDWGPLQAYERVNVGGTRTLAQAAVVEGVRRFVLVSSLAVHHYRGIDGGTEEEPRDGHIVPYCHSKIGAEDAVRRCDLEWVVARPGVFPFGPRDRTSFLHLARALEKGGPGVVSGGRAVLCTAYVENLALGLRLCVEHPAAARQVFVLADPWRVTWRELFDRFARELGVAPPWLDAPYGPAMAVAGGLEGLYRALGVERAPPLTRYRVLVAARDCWFSSEKAARILGFAPRVDLEEAVRRTVGWYRSLG